MYKAAMRSVISELFRQDRIVVTDKIDIKQPKTKDLLKILNKSELTDVLLVNDSFDENLFLSARNIKNVGVCDANSITPVNLMRYQKVLLTIPALKLIEERLA